MAKTTQKLVLSFDAESQTYKPAGHNLSPEQAIEQGTFVLKGPPFLVLAVQTNAQWKPGMLFGANGEGKEETEEMKRTMRIMPRPFIDSKTLQVAK